MPAAMNTTSASTLPIGCAHPSWVINQANDNTNITAFATVLTAIGPPFLIPFPAALGLKSPNTKSVERRGKEDSMDTSLKDFKLVLWNIPAENVPNAPGTVADLTIDQSSNPALVDMLNSGWRIVNHTVIPISGGGIMLTLFMERGITVPDNI